MLEELPIGKEPLALTKRQKNAAKIALVLSSIDGQVQAALYMPILALITQTFGNSSIVNFSFSITSGVMVVVIFLAGYLAKFFDKRNMMILGTCLFILGGFLGSFAPSAEVLVATRVVEGIGAGFVYPMVPAISSQLFTGEERSQLMGFLNGGACIIAFFLNFLAGAVGALFGWRVCLYIYAILVISIFLQIKYIPKLGPEKNILDIYDENGNKKRVPKVVFGFALLSLLFSCCLMIFNLTLSGYITSAGIGDSTVAGTAGAVQTFVGFIIGIIFVNLLKAFKKFLPVFALVCIGAGYFILSNATDAIGICLGMGLVGMAPGIVYPLLNDAVARHCSDSTVTMGMSYVSNGMLIGNFLCTFWVDFLNGVLGGSYVAIFQTVSIIALAAAAVFAVVAIIGIVRGKSAAEA